MRRRHTRLDHPFVAHFVTTTIVDWSPVFGNATIAETSLTSFEKYREEMPIHCIGFVLMPHHFHALLYQEEKNVGISRLLMNFKKATSVQIRDYVAQEATATSLMQAFEEHGKRFHAKRPRRQVWTDRYDDVAIVSRRAIRTKLNYLHSNPVRAGLSEKPEDYIYSSARDYAGNPNPWITVNCELGNSIGH